MKTSTPKPQAPKWLLVDAAGQSLGHLAAKVATILRGKHRPDYSMHQISGDHVVVINAGKLEFSQAKLRRKTYYKHSGYLGHLKARPLARMAAERPTEVIKKAIYGMLPANRLRPVALKRLHIYAGAEHDHTAQKPVSLPLR
ncbi:MAG: 50S ribosomal protein L13 [Candidatus Peribacteraceae bacterium]|nr:50S ribosomal protein L13 [Candidatus Peribacteraceae bacterium]